MLECEWQSLVRSLSVLQAEEQMSAAAVASVPHMDKRSRQDQWRVWQRAATRAQRLAGSLRDQVGNIRSWLGSHGIGT